MGETKNGSKYREQLLASPVGDWQLRAQESDGPANSLGILSGHFAVFNRWTEIDNFFEGRFLEKISAGAFTKTFQENKAIRCLFNHGRDPSIGMKSLGPIRSLDQDDHGAAYEVDLDDTSYNRDLAPGLRSGQYGSSFRFQVIKEEVDSKPKRSDENPEGIPQRTVQEVRLMEFGPVTFPAYADATAGLRSLDPFEFLDFTGVARMDPDNVARFLAFYCDEDTLKLARKLRSAVRKSVSSARTSDDDPEVTTREESESEPESREGATSTEAPVSQDDQSEPRSSEVSLYVGDDPLDLEKATLTPSTARSLITSNIQEAPPWKL